MVMKRDVLDAFIEGGELVLVMTDQSERRCRCTECAGRSGGATREKVAS